MTDAPPPIVVPRVATERLLLREVCAGDFDAYASFLADPETTRFLSGVVDRRTAWRQLAALAGAWTLTGAGWWAVEERASGALAGIVGAFHRETSLPIGRDSDLELGWTIFPPFQRNGYATEAARAALACGVERHDPPRVVAHMNPANAASVGVARAIGMTFDGEVDFYGQPAVRFVLARRATLSVR